MSGSCDRQTSDPDHRHLDSEKSSYFPVSTRNSFAALAAVEYPHFQQFECPFKVVADAVGPRCDHLTEL
jgi:hypothetical protein